MRRMPRLRQKRSLRLTAPMSKLYLGIDTSNYTTSAALTDESGTVLESFRQLLTVKPGERGLRQSDAVFQHIKNSESAAAAVRACVERHGGAVAAVGVSATPTYAEGSYMPCFMTGLALAEMTAAAHGVPLHRFSHQAGHIAAALYSADARDLAAREFAAFHVSGGTTDIISVTPDPERVIFPRTVGGTLDLNAGQLIDRVGVAMGLGFPAGREMEKLALACTSKIPRARISVRGIECNLSGIENKALELYASSGDRALTAAFVIRAVGDVISAMLDGVYEKFGRVPVVLAGGVMSCRILHDRLSGEDRYFAEPAYSCDNAAGIAVLTQMCECGTK